MQHLPPLPVGSSFRVLWHLPFSRYSISELLRTYPGPLTLHAPPLSIPLVGSWYCIVGFAIAMLEAGDRVSMPIAAWLAGLSFPALVVYTTIAAWTGRERLVFDHEGFTVHGVFRSKRMLWSEVTGLRFERGNGPRHFVVAKGMSLFEGQSIHASYGLTTGDMLCLFEGWRERVLTDQVHAADWLD